MLAMDKELSKYIFIKNDILTPKFITLKNENINLKIKKIKKIFNSNVVIKPLNEDQVLMFIYATKIIY